MAAVFKGYVPLNFNLELAGCNRPELGALMRPPKDYFFGAGVVVVKTIRRGLTASGVRLRAARSAGLAIFSPPF